MIWGILIGFIIGFCCCLFLVVRADVISERKKQAEYRENHFGYSQDENEYIDGVYARMDDEENIFISYDDINQEPIEFSYNKVTIPGIGVYEFEKPVDVSININSGFEIVFDSYDDFDKFMEWNGDSYYLMAKDYKRTVVLENDEKICNLSGCFPSNIEKNNKNSKKMKVSFYCDFINVINI